MLELLEEAFRWVPSSTIAATLASARLLSAWHLHARQQLASSSGPVVSSVEVVQELLASALLLVLLVQEPNSSAAAVPWEQHK